MSLHPKTPKDLTLAPVAVEIDLNLRSLRDQEPKDVLVALELELDRPMTRDDREQRAKHVLEAAVRLVDLHGWQATITADASRLRLSGGSVSLDLGLGAALARYIEAGANGSSPRA